MKKKIISIVSIIIVLGSIIIMYERKDNKKEIKSNGMFAIMLEKEKGTGKYDYAKDNRWSQSDEYVINMYKSYCENGSILRWNNESKRMKVTVKGTDKCFVYFDKGEYGTKEHPRLIQTIEDLVRLSNDVAKGKTYAGEYFLLTNDLDFNDASDYENANRTDFKDINGINGDEALIKELTTGSGFIPIGNGLTNSFQGIFEGNNKTIANLYINNNIVGKVIGLFGDITDATISNLSVEGKIVSNVRSVRSGIIGRASGTNKITNLVNYVNVSSNQNEWDVGGIVGANFDTLEITNVKNYGKLNGGRNTGGVVGYNKGTITLKNVENYGEITNTIAIDVGGIIGTSDNITNDNNHNGILNMENVHNYGKITNNYSGKNENRTGGLIGFSSGSIIIKNSHNEGEIKHSRINYDNFISSIVGGLVGQIFRINNDLSENKITNSYNNGNIYGGTYAGGIIGNIYGNTKTIINKTYNMGKIDNSNLSFVSPNLGVETSGIISYNDGGNYITKSFIINSYNLGEIKGFDGAGGLMALSFSNVNNTIINSYNTGKISSQNGYFGTIGSNGIGIFAKFDKSNSNVLFINNVYNYGTTNNLHVINVDDTINPQINNLYYNEELIETNYGISKPTAYIKSQSFVDELNQNIKNINLEEIDASLKDITLNSWQLDKDGYPTLIYSK